MKQPKAVDLPNYGVLECELEEEDINNLWKLVHKYSPNAKWEGNRLLEIDQENKQFALCDDDELFQNNVGTRTKCAGHHQVSFFLAAR